MLQRLNRSRAARVTASLTLTAVFFVGCISSEFGVSDTADAGTTPNDSSDSASTPPEEDTGTTTTATDATVTPTPDASDDAALDSGPPPPATMVTISTPSNGSFSIDATEVTQAQYLAFLVAKAGDVSGQPTPRCDFNVNYTPSGALWDPATRPNVPVTSVDWCDARAYCAWAGKHLCGGFKGAALAYADSDKPGTSQWMYACTNAGVQLYPYGTTENKAACNINRPDGGVVQEAGSFPACIGGFPGTYDMVGNATEWIDACDTGSCVILGGSWAFPNTGSVACGQFTAAGPSYIAPDLGFRCCKD